MKTKIGQTLITPCIVALGFLLMGCSSDSDLDPKDMRRELALHTEGVGEGNIVTKVLEQRKEGVYSIHIQVIKGGKMTETVHYFEDQAFSVSVPVSSTIMVSSAKEATKSADTNILLFSQKLDVAREAMMKTDYIKALEALNSALQIDSYNPQAHMMKGSIFYAMGKEDLARKEFDYVLKVDPENMEVKRFKQFLEQKPGNTSKTKIEGPEGQ